MSMAWKIALAVLVAVAVAATAYVAIVDTASDLALEETTGPDDGGDPGDAEDPVVAGTAEARAGLPVFHLRDDETWARILARLRDWGQEIRDPETRPGAIAEILKAVLEAEEEERILAGLLALRSLSPYPFDRYRVRTRVIQLLGSSRADIRWAALCALTAVRAGLEALESVLPLARDPYESVRRTAVVLIVRLAGRNLTGRAAGEVLHSLSNERPETVRRILTEMLITQIPSGALIDRVIDLSRSEDYETMRRAVDALGGIASPPNRTLDRLLEVLADSYHECQRSAFIALRDIPESSRPRVAERVLWILEKTDQPVVMSFCLDLLVAHRAYWSVNRIEYWAASRHSLTETQRGWATRAVETLVR